MTQVTMVKVRPLMPAPAPVGRAGGAAALIPLRARGERRGLVVVALMAQAS
jgi:hypothetical protein